MDFRCRERDCAKRFSVRSGTIMQSSKLSYQTWAIATYLVVTNLKSISSMKLHRELKTTQKSAWHLAHRLREAMTARDRALSQARSSPTRPIMAVIQGDRRVDQRVRYVGTSSTPTARGSAGAAVHPVRAGQSD